MEIVKKLTFIIFVLSFICLVMGCGGGGAGTGTPALGGIIGIASLEGQSSHNGVTVSIVGATLSTNTSTSGVYSISDVPAGTYSVIASKSGYESSSKEGVVVGVGQTTADINFYLISTSPPPAPFWIKYEK